MKNWYVSLLFLLMLCTHEAAAQNEKLPCDSTVSVPASFTPNQDGINETLIPHFEIVPWEFKFSVYNRWGNLLFETSDLQKAWYPSNEPAGVYYWTVKYKYSRSSDWFQCSGNVSLLK